MTCSRTLFMTAAAALFSTSPLFAQTTAAPGPASPSRAPIEIGATWGRGPFNYDEDDPGSRTMFGVEACLRCGRRAFFVDYSHWMPPHPSTYQTGYREADSFAGGLRFQKQARVRPFFDVGGVVASSRYSRSAGTENRGLVGGMVGSGLTIPIDKFYVRVQGRVMFMNDFYIGANLSVAGGFRF